MAAVARPALPAPCCFTPAAENFCRWAARVVATFDRHEELALLPLGDEEAVRLLASVPEGARDECWWLILRDGTAIPGDAGGGVALLGEIRLTRPLGRLLGELRASPLIDGVDKFVARRRSGLGRFGAGRPGAAALSLKRWHRPEPASLRSAYS